MSTPKRFCQRVLLVCTDLLLLLLLLLLDQGSCQSIAFLHIKKAMNGQVRLRCGDSHAPRGVQPWATQGLPPCPQLAHTPIFVTTRASTICWVAHTLSFVLERLAFFILNVMQSQRRLPISRARMGFLFKFCNCYI